MDLAFQHSQGQRILRQRNMLVVALAVLALLMALVLLWAGSRSREVVLQPILRSPLTLSSSGVSRDYLELVTRDVALLVLDRSPTNLEYWMESVLAVTSPKAHGKIKGDLMKIVTEQRGSSIAQFFTMESMTIDAKSLRSEVTGHLSTIVGSKVVTREPRTFRFDWEYTGVSLRLIGFGMVVKKPEENN
ncbi:conjugal transfer pilus assembly protein TraE [Sphingomonas zeicaulis]|uniref:type IV conjugative transfer system protein TraE n=1 Tax=Sphingomonas zeicaulis TaxID=1632740 RepID=UPI003D24FFE5